MRLARLSTASGAPPGNLRGGAANPPKTPVSRAPWRWRALVAAAATEGCGASERPAIYSSSLEDVVFAQEDASCVAIDGGATTEVRGVCPTLPRPVAATAPVRLRINLEGRDVDGVVRFCAGRDAVCANLVLRAMVAAAGTTVVTLPLGPDGFDGYAEVEAPGALPSRSDLHGAIREAYDLTLFAPSFARVASFGGGVNVARGTRGMLVVVSRRCDDGRQSGMRIELDRACGGATRAYDTATGWSEQATATGYAGEAVFAGLPAGVFFATIREADTGRVRAVRRAEVQAGWVTSVVERF